MTGQDEVKRLVKMLSETFPKEAAKEEEKTLDLDNFSSEPTKEEEIKEEKGSDDDLHLGMNSYL